MRAESPVSSSINCSDMDVVACFPLHIGMFESILGSIMEAFALETAKIAVRVFLGVMYVSVGDGFVLELIGNWEKAGGEVVEDGKVDDDCGGSKHYGGANGENGEALSGEWTGSDDGDDNESDEDDASDQQGSGERDENGEEEDEDEELSEEEEESCSGSDSDEDEDPILDHAMEIYDSDSFSLFRHEYEKCKALLVDCVDEFGPDWKYEVKRELDISRPFKCYRLSASFLSETVECCCNHFAVTGMLCSHALAVLKFLHIDHIPDQYLLKWRLKSMNQSSTEDTSFQKRRKILPSNDDCLNRLLKKKKKTGEDSEEDTGLLFELPIFGFDINCGVTNHFGSPILIHAKQIYVSEAYELFRKEHRKSECLIAEIRHKFADWRGLVYDFEVFGFKVHAEPQDGTIKCSCRKFETSGILCAHSLAVFSSICIVKIPHQYLVPRLLKDPNMAADQNIHGPDYEDMLEFAVNSIIRNGSSTMIPRHTSRSDDEENLVAVNGELLEVAKNHASKKRKAGDIEEEEEMSGKWKLYDDQLIKDFTYKNPELRKRKLMDYTKSFPTNIF